MAPARGPRPLSFQRSADPVDINTLARARTQPPGSSGKQSSWTAKAMDLFDKGVALDAMRRLHLRVALIDATGQFPQAVIALRKFLEKKTRFVAIPETYASKVWALHGEEHCRTAERLCSDAALDEAALMWFEQGRIPPSDGLLKPVTAVLDWKSGQTTYGISDDNATYFGSTIKSVLRIEVKHINPPRGQLNRIHFALRIVEWKAWVVDNYDWNGNHVSDIAFAALGLPTHFEMRAIEQAGYGKSYKRSSDFKLVVPGEAAWNDSVASFEELKSKGRTRSSKRSQRQRDAATERQGGAIDDPEPATTEQAKLKSPAG